MTGLSLSQAQEHLDQWLAADKAVSNSQSYTIGSRSLTRSDVDQIREQIQYWQAEVDRARNRQSGRQPVLYSRWV